MQHSVKGIGENHESLSNMRNDKIKFNSNDFLKFAKENKDKYKLIENGDDLLVGTWYSNDLINDYRNSLK